MATVKFGLLVLLLLPASAEAQPGRGCRGGSFSVVRVGPGAVMPLPGGPGGRVNAPCEPKAPDFVAEDSRALLAGIKLTKVQNDSLTKLRKSYLGLQKTMTDQALASYNRGSDTTVIREHERTGNDRIVFLTPEMRKMRELFAADLRVLMLPDQNAKFDANAAALKKKEG